MKNCSLDQKRKNLDKWQWIWMAWVPIILLVFAAFVGSTNLGTAPEIIRLKWSIVIFIILLVPGIIREIKGLRYKKLVKSQNLNSWA